ncbi:MAG: hypothetical protein D4R56_04905 [Deltaproteobacteria bacterium]|nr:MAG: hypothetical protein D4R56_04905 [Deltaproteobacteria bacterium]
MKSAKIFLTAAVISVFLFIGGSNALAMQSVGGNLNGFSTGKQQIGVGYAHFGAITTSVKRTPMDPTRQPPDPKDPADEH